MANIYVRSTDGNDADDGSTWALAKATLVGALAIATNADTIWVSDAHAETQTGSMTLTCPTSAGLKILCGDDAAEPPTALATTATVTTTTSGSMTVNGFAYIYGITFSCGTAANSTNLAIATGASLNHGFVLENCGLFILSTSSSFIRFGIGGGGATGHASVHLRNPIFKTAHGSNAIQLRAAKVTIDGASMDAASVALSFMFTWLSGTNALPTGPVIVEASDFSGGASALIALVNVAVNNPVELVLRNCKLHASTTVTTGTNPGPGGPVVILENCDSGDTNYKYTKVDWSGTVSVESTIIRTSGASDGTTGVSIKMVSSANASLVHPLKGPEIASKWNDTTGSAKTATVEMVNDGSTLTNAEAWIEVMHLGTSGFPLGVIDLDDKVASVIATPANQTTSSVAWTTTGLTSPVKQKMESTFTPQEKGVYYVKPCLGKASTTLYYCPLIDETGP